MLTVQDIYDYLDEIMPFSAQEKWDNSGLIVGDKNAEATGIMTCLDITAAAVEEAHSLGVQLIISHHPVIFDPVKTVTSESVVYRLIRYGISAICCHTNADIADCGTNGIAYDMMKDILSLGERTVLDTVCPDGSGIGWICGCTEISPDELAEKLGTIYKGCPIKYTAPDKKIRRLAFCSGSGGSLLEEAAAAECDALITGDVKHDRFVEAENRGLALFDCTHYGTEIPFADKTAEYLSEKFHQLAVYSSDHGKGYIRTL